MTAIESSLKVDVRVRGKWVLRVAGWFLSRFRSEVRVEGGRWKPFGGRLVITWTADDDSESIELGRIER